MIDATRLTNAEREVLGKALTIYDGFLRGVDKRATKAEVHHKVVAESFVVEQLLQAIHR